MTTTLRSSLVAAFVLAGLSALFLAGAAVQGEPAKSPLVDTLGAGDLGKFAVVDMADALGRVAGPVRADSEQ